MGSDRLTPLAGKSRIVSLDQFRGYTVLGMFLVNFVGHFDVIPAILKHHNTYCSYADTIMPEFFFAVGYAYRLTFLRRLREAGPRAAYGHAVRRNLGLILLGMVIYHLQGSVTSWAQLARLGFSGFMKQAFLRDPFETLVHIGVTSLWILPVIGGPAAARVGFTILSAALHLFLSNRFYYTWVWEFPGIDGGPLGFMTWTIPTLVGSLAYDAMVPAVKADSRARLGAAAFRLLGWGAVLMALGYVVSCLNLWSPPNADLAKSHPLDWFVEPPFTPPSRPINIWTMSQRAGSISYLTFGAGFSLAVYALFIWLSDLGGVQLGIFRTFGSNALAAYIIHLLVMDAIHPYAPNDAPLWFALGTFALFLGICYIFVRHLEKNKLFLRL